MNHVTPADGDPIVTIGAAHNGPDGSGNGGYSAGLLAERLTAPGGPAVEVTLRTPPPLEDPLTLTTDGAVLTMSGRETVAEARAADLTDEAVPGAPVDPATAKEAEARYPGLSEHPFPRCYSCGPERAEGDGLRLFPGSVRAGSGPDNIGNTVACTWVPGPELDDGTGHADLRQTWAALDCPGGWSSDIVGRPIVLGRMTAQVAEAPRTGHTHVVTGHLHAVEGRKVLTGSALHDSEGRLLARARATWITLRS
ncbi:hypothetical protein IDM40_03165 [Nocardiopsis sp. HNM0947]|uniref:Thioesterase superfamily protein n=1 Tax=Nocardiopsis coralli TaxID=2772213 RepID=A0ABR9P1J0_9ACTN|nr:hypothetical protein [Nocardiopsis coralli]MBE2997711.1 hypothetical protein [Nocardiopsis coralli]